MRYNLLRRARLINFQSHIDTEIEFTPGINLITGTSDHGKSAILRGLKWNFFNLPFRDSGFKNESATDAAEMSVAVEFSDDTKVTRFKVKTDNGYKITDNNKPVAIKTGVPDEVSDILNISDINLQEQHNPYFLLNEKGSSVAAAFNEMVGLQVMDECVAAAKQEVNASSNKLKAIKIQLTSVNDALSSLPDISSLSPLVDKIDSAYARLVAINTMYNDIASIIIEYDKLQNTISLCDPVIKKLSNICNNIDKQSKRITICENKYSYISTTIDDIERLEKIISNTTIPSINIEDLFILGNDITHKENDIKTIQNLCNTYNTVSENIDRLSKEKEALSEEAEEIMSTYKECPLCNSIL